MYLFHSVGFLALTNLFGKSLDTAHRYNGYIEDQLICKDSLIAFFSSLTFAFDTIADVVIVKIVFELLIHFYSPMISEPTKKIVS